MQISKSYSGTIESTGAATARQVSFGVTGNVTVYPGRVDFVNQTIADFLHDECGVDAVYEAREGSDYKFLWIYDVPFLFSPPGYNSSQGGYFNFYGPLNANILFAGSTGTSAFFNGYSSTVYSFKLYFTGNPDTGFALRMSTYNGASPSGLFVKFYKAKNIINNRDAVVWSVGNTVSQQYIYMNGVDLDENGVMDADSFSTDYISANPTLRSKVVNKTSNPGKLPLVPLLFGVWKVPGVYQYPLGFDLPEATYTTVPIQTEVEISGRRFIVTSINSLSSLYINLGLVEVFD